MRSTRAALFAAPAAARTEHRGKIFIKTLNKNTTKNMLKIMY